MNKTSETMTGKPYKFILETLTSVMLDIFELLLDIPIVLFACQYRYLIIIVHRNEIIVHNIQYCSMSKCLKMHIINMDTYIL